MNILICVDLSESTDKVEKRAEQLINISSAKMWILYVAEPESNFVSFDAGPQSVRDSLAKQFHSEHRKIQEIAGRLRRASLDAKAFLVQGSIAETILKEASKLKADIIVVGSHGRGAAYKFLVGSVSEQVIRKAKCPVLVVPTHERT